MCEQLINEICYLQAIPGNLFIIAACNPHRADSLALYRKETPDDWIKAAYYVQELHPTLRHLIWDYGALNDVQESQYITAKMEMLVGQGQLSEAECDALGDLIVTSQSKMRQYALDNVKCLKGLSLEQAKLCSRSCVSQRDIQRVFTFYCWLMKVYRKYNPHQEKEESFHRRAVMVSLGLVYYMRLNSKFRQDYCKYLDKYEAMVGEVTFSKAYDSDLQWFVHHLELPAGIAPTVALKENVFAIIACTMTHTPLIIVGDPGTSKTLSFNVVVANLKGVESKVKIFRDTNIFKSLDPHFYQCSKRTTSKEVEKVFYRAVNRQKYLAKVPLPVFSVVLMDEAGLPEDDIESLKALHYHLDLQEVSFVAISNHVLDAAKTNRCVSLFRPRLSNKELQELALVSIGQKTESAETKKSHRLINALVRAYECIQAEQDADFKRLFGLRDFIFFVTNLRRQTIKLPLNLQMIVNGVQRNFNGTEDFEKLCKIFIQCVS